MYNTQHNKTKQTKPMINNRKIHQNAIKNILPYVAGTESKTESSDY